MTPEEKATDARARRWARKMGYEMVRERAGICVVNTGGYQLRNAQGKVIAGKKFDLSPQDILAMCEAKDVWVPQGVLGIKLREYCEESGCSLQELTVMATNNDPYRWDNEKGHRDGQWCKEMIDRFASRQGVHPRGLHYRIVSAGDVTRPWNAKKCLQWIPYLNDFPAWKYVSEAALEAARWLGYVEFDRIMDERNAPPEVCTLEELQKHATGELAVGGVLAEPFISTDITMRARVGYRQPYRIVMIGEKSSLRTVLLPIAQRVRGELILPNGELSNRHCYDMCLRAVEDGRPMIVLYFSDFDPSGYNMPTNVARRIQALRDLYDWDLEVEVRQVGLTYQQAVEYDLPSTPLKPGELRGAAWKARWDREQTEIDALAALRPEILTEITIEATKPYFDWTADDRARERATNWEHEAIEILEAHPLYEESVERLEQAEASVEEALEAVREAADQAREELGEIEIPAIEGIEVELSEPVSDPIYDSTQDWVEATLKLKERRALVPGEEQADEGDEED